MFNLMLANLPTICKTKSGKCFSEVPNFSEEGRRGVLRGRGAHARPAANFLGYRRDEVPQQSCFCRKIVSAVADIYLWVDTKSSLFHCLIATRSNGPSVNGIWIFTAENGPSTKVLGWLIFGNRYGPARRSSQQPTDFLKHGIWWKKRRTCKNQKMSESSSFFCFT